MGRRLGLRARVAVSAAVIDAHAGVPGAGVGEAGTLVMVMGTSGCHMLLAETEHRVPGVAGVVKDGILPGFYGYETGQAAMGDAFDLVRRLTGHTDFLKLDAMAAAVPPGSGGVLALDWFNGCRTPLMDGALTGGLLGVTVGTRPEQVHRAVLEGSAFGLGWVVDTLRAGGVPVERFVATGGLPTSNPLFLKIVASVLGEPVLVHPARHGSAMGAAILASLAAGRESGGFESVAEAVARMAGAESELPPAKTVDPDPRWMDVYGRLYPLYRQLADEMAREGSVLRRLGACAQGM
jgi:L-ribulokinase